MKQYMYRKNKTNNSVNYSFNFCTCEENPKTQDTIISQEKEERSRWDAGRMIERDIKERPNWSFIIFCPDGWVGRGGAGIATLAH